jgi:hypothetical protein
MMFKRVDMVVSLIRESQLLWIVYESSISTRTAGFNIISVAPRIHLDRLTNFPVKSFIISLCPGARSGG